MPKKSADKEFERMLEALLQEHVKQLLSERIKRGMKQAKLKKSRQRS